MRMKEGPWRRAAQHSRYFEYVVYQKLEKYEKALEYYERVLFGYEKTMEKTRNE